MRYPRQLFLALIATLALTEACGSGGTTASGGSITLSLIPTSATIQQGGSTQVTGTVVRTDFTGDIAISVTGAPTGVTGSVTLAPINGGNTAQVTIAVGSSVAVGPYTLTVTASGNGITSARATFTLNVTAATSASYTMTLGTPSQSIAPGGTAPSTITFVRTAFTGNITLSAENLPGGVTAAFATNPVSGTSSSVTFTATTAATPGTYNTILIRGTAVGPTDVTASVTLTVTVTGSFTIAAGSGSLNVTPGNNVTTSVNATRTGGFAGTIVYTVTGPSNAALPTGLTAAVTPTGTADQNTLTVTTTAGLAQATYPIVVHGTSSGLTPTANVNVVVGTAGSGLHLDYSLCPTSAKPIWLAYQDGTGAWTHVVASADVYTFNITSAKGAIAMVTPGSNYTTFVNYLTQGEFAAYTSGCAATVTGKTINGTLNGVSAGYSAVISMGGGSTQANGPATTFQLTGVASGSQDLVAYNRNANTPGGSLDRVIIRRGLNIADLGSVTPVLDFTAIEALFPTTFNITVGGATNGNSISQSQSYLTGSACTSHLLYNKAGTTNAIFAYGIPTASQVTGDFYRLSVTEQLSGTVGRTVATSFHTLADRTVTMGANFTQAVTDVTGASPYLRLQSAFTLPTDYQTAYLAYSSTLLNFVFINQSAAYLGGASSVTIAMPDLTSAGYLGSYGPPTAYAANVVTTAIGTSGGGAGCTEGGVTKTITLNAIF